MLLQLAELGWLDRSLEAGELRDALSELVAACDNEDTLALTLRRFRSRQQVRIIWRDLTRQAAWPRPVATSPIWPMPASIWPITGSTPAIASNSACPPAGAAAIRSTW